MITLTVLFLATLFLAYSNGANDNFKGVATLFGSGATSYKAAITWATISTFAGSITSLFMAETLLKNFSGRGIVPNELAAAPQFVLTVGLGAGLTVMLATFTGFPVSTTHALVGALVGAGLTAVGTSVNFGTLGALFFLPLLASPLLAVGLGVVSYVAARGVRVKLGVKKEWCVCIDQVVHYVPIPQPAGLLALAPVTVPEISVGPVEHCRQQYKGKLFGGEVQRGLDIVHFLSAGTVGFARGLNDTPKIVALLLVIKTFDVKFGMLLVAVAMAIGGLLNAKKVAITMSKRITPLNPGQGFTANLVTSTLVIFASRFGLPVSTTHVSVGSLFGIGLITKEANRRVVSGILMSWLLTLPIAAILSAAIYAVVSLNHG
ncbi:MAG TPA: inorganic phosphate transporter [Pyrinomonadaceae bacterium]|nr:inorganic phosphate transporter [Pyrinomonadaceae bacterium]